MKTLYENSTWGYNIDEKRQELQHPHARFILITTSLSEAIDSEAHHNNNINQDNASTNTNANMLVAFVHYRYCYDDDDDPAMIVLYIYEMQVRETYQKQGIGLYCMRLMEQIAQLPISSSTGDGSNSSTSKENKTTMNKAIPKGKSGHNKKKANVGHSIHPHTNATSTTTTGGNRSSSNIQKIMLTVFRQNTTAMQFYRKKLQYNIDPSSPSQYHQVTDYEILSKSTLASG
jgi:GNAT superfamily N-acetyltransferase